MNGTTLALAFTAVALSLALISAPAPRASDGCTTIDDLHAQFPTSVFVPLSDAQQAAIIEVVGKTAKMKAAGAGLNLMSSTSVEDGTVKVIIGFDGKCAISQGEMSVDRFQEIVGRLQ